MPSSSLPDLARLSLAPTGEFYALDRDEADGREDPITTEPLDRDCERDDTDCRPTFRVRTNPKPGGGFHYLYYDAENLWLWVKDHRTDMISKMPVWRENWMALHEKYDPEGEIPVWVSYLPRMNKTLGEDTDDETEDGEEEGEEEWWDWGVAQEEEEEVDSYDFIVAEEMPSVSVRESALFQETVDKIDDQVSKLLGDWREYVLTADPNRKRSLKNMVKDKINTIEESMTDPMWGNFYRQTLFAHYSVRATISLIHNLVDCLVACIVDTNMTETVHGKSAARSAIVLLSRLLARPSQPVMPMTSSRASVNRGIWKYLREHDLKELEYSIYREMRAKEEVRGGVPYNWSERENLVQGQHYLHFYLAGLQVSHYLLYDDQVRVVPTWLLYPPLPEYHTPLVELRVQEDVAQLSNLGRSVVELSETVHKLAKFLKVSYVGVNEAMQMDTLFTRISEQLGFVQDAPQLAMQTALPSGIMKALQDCRANPDIEKRLIIVQTLYAITVFYHAWAIMMAELLDNEETEEVLARVSAKLRRALELAVETTEPTLQRGGRAGKDTMQAFFWRRIARFNDWLKVEEIGSDEDGWEPIVSMMINPLQRVRVDLPRDKLTQALAVMGSDWAPSVWADDYNDSPEALANADAIEEAERESQLARARAEPRYYMRSRRSA